MPWIEHVSCFSPPRKICYHHSIANQHSLEIDGLTWNYWCFIFQNLISKEWKVHSTVWLSRYPKFVFRKFREFSVPSFQGKEVISCCSCIIVQIACVFIDGKANSWRGLEEYNIGFGIPCVRINALWEVLGSLVEKVRSKFLWKS